MEREQATCTTVVRGDRAKHVDIYQHGRKKYNMNDAQHPASSGREYAPLADGGVSCPKALVDQVSKGDKAPKSPQQKKRITAKGARNLSDKQMLPCAGRAAHRTGNTKELRKWAPISGQKADKG